MKHARVDSQMHLPTANAGLAFSSCIPYPPAACHQSQNPRPQHTPVTSHLARSILLPNHERDHDLCLLLSCRLLRRSLSRSRSRSRDLLRLRLRFRSSRSLSGDDAPLSPLRPPLSLSLSLLLLLLLRLRSLPRSRSLLRLLLLLPRLRSLSRSRSLLLLLLLLRFRRSSRPPRSRP